MALAQFGEVPVGDGAVSGDALGPRLDERRSLRRIAVEQVGDAACQRPPVSPQPMAGQCQDPLVQFLEHGPRQSGKTPRVGVLRGAGGVAQRGGDETAREHELDVGAHPEAVADIAEPAAKADLDGVLDTRRGHHHDVGGERVGHRRAQHLGERVEQWFEPFRVVEVDHGDTITVEPLPSGRRFT